MIKSIQTLVAAAMLIAMLAFPAFSMAETPADKQYGGTDQNLGSQVNSGGGSSDPGDPAGPSADSAGLGGNVGPLPFTGFDVIAMAAVALAVTGVGLALQRAVARESGS